MTGTPLIPRSAVPVAHGWTLADAERIAGRAARDHPSSLLPRPDRRDIGVHAVIEAILTASEAPSRNDLIRAASDAISRASVAERNYRGMSWRDPGETAPRFARYWNAPLGAPFEDDLVDVIAVRQVVEGIHPSWRRDLETLAREGSYGAAAEALGTSAVTFRSRISKARAAASEMWFAPEDAPGMWGSDRRGETARSRPVTRCVRTRARDRRAEAARAAA